ncbi:MAG: bacteriohemerythrin [Defluviicoccus sp.]|nr:bacteriohemerythrin [Defluviicoccus sp.]MDG4610300.1 bacteriohemerythrin [Defluviicoccus sp.]
MALFIWKSSFSVGVDRFDTDHIIITSLINHIDDAKLSGSDEAAVGMILNALISYSIGHFRREEQLLTEKKDPNLPAHREQHHMVEQQLADLYADYQRCPDADTSREIMELLNFWITEHILRVDMRYKALFA